MKNDMSWIDRIIKDVEQREAESFENMESMNDTLYFDKIHDEARYIEDQDNDFYYN